MKYVPKTNRKRGVIYGRIIYTSLILPEFTPHNLTPAMTFVQADANCRRLAILGELRVVRPGKKGRGGRTTVYASAWKHWNARKH